MLSLYAKGMSVSDIKIQLQELYSVEISESLISQITDDVMDDVKAWQSRPLEEIYPIVSFEAKWNKQYPQIAKSWYNHWDNLMIFLGYPEAIRQVIYTTNSVESVNSQLRKVTNNKRVFPNDNAVFKSLYDN